MSTVSLSTVISPLARVSRRLGSSRLSLRRPSLSALGQDQDHLPRLVRESAVAMRYLRLLGPLDWGNLPQRAGRSFWPDTMPLPLSAFAAAYLVKLDQHLLYMPDLRQYLVDHPPLSWVLGFPLIPSRRFSWGFDVDGVIKELRAYLSRAGPGG